MTVSARPLALAAPVALLFLGACASTPEVDPVAEKLGRHDQRISALEREVMETRASVDGIGAAGLGSSVGMLEEELRELRGEVESLRYRLREVQAQRIRGGANAGASAAPSVAAPPPTAAPRGSGSSRDDQSDYLAAFGKLKTGAYGDAASAFRDFLQEHPGSAYAPNAQYWIGEAYYVQREFDRAWEAFSAVLEKYPDSLKAADARLKQGLIRVDQGRMQDARAILQEVATQHAGSSAGRIAAERLQRMGGG